MLAAADESDRFKDSPPTFLVSKKGQFTQIKLKQTQIIISSESMKKKAFLLNISHPVWITAMLADDFVGRSLKFALLDRVPNI